MSPVLIGVVIGASVIAVGFSCVAAACVLMAQMTDDVPDAGEADEPEPQFEFRDVNPIPFDRSAARERVRAAIDREAVRRGWTAADEAALRDLLSGAS